MSWLVLCRIRLPGERWAIMSITLGLSFCLASIYFFFYHIGFYYSAVACVTMNSPSPLSLYIYICPLPVSFSYSRFSCGYSSASCSGIILWVLNKEPVQLAACIGLQLEPLLRLALNCLWVASLCCSQKLPNVWPVTARCLVASMGWSDYAGTVFDCEKLPHVMFVLAAIARRLTLTRLSEWATLFLWRLILLWREPWRHAAVTAHLVYLPVAVFWCANEWSKVLAPRSGCQ